MNIQEIDKWLDNEYGCSYTRLEELHDFLIEQDMKHQEKAHQELDRYKKIIVELENYFIDMFNKTQDIKYLDDLEKLRKLKEDM